mmetsp:Transcript_27793/g.90416  ORF Transcript_27793/g.90416 Transcript_27793/m.90416 type:complete len:554 (-) Transcript_27793:1828-3489(-)
MRPWLSFWTLRAVAFMAFLQQDFMARADFYYPDFSRVCDPSLTCVAQYAGTLSCCTSFNADASSRLYINDASYFQTCSQFKAPNGIVPGLKGIESVFGKDTEANPQILFQQVTAYDYVVSPRRSVNYNWTRSPFEEVVRRRDELRYMLNTALTKLQQSRENLTMGLESETEGQIWLVIAMYQAEVTRISNLYNLTLERDEKLFKEHTKEYQAIHPHNDYNSSCDNRMRLTPAAPSRKGSIWYQTPQNVTNGFITSFKFQLTARNRFCRQVVDAHADQMKGTALTFELDQCLRMEWNASEWNQRVYGLGGGDGFAFVLQSNGSSSVGESGDQLGYGGIPDSLAIEFDTFANRDIGDINDLHVAVHTGGCRTPNSASQQTCLASYGSLRNTGRLLQDGEVHQVMIVYTPGVQFNPQSQQQWSSKRYLNQFIKADGAGTLRVFIDDMSSAILNMPLSLKYAMKLNQGAAFVGFTAATGSMWQSHDILEWEFRQYSADPSLECKALTSTLITSAYDQCVQEKSWATFNGQPLTGSPFFEAGTGPWVPSRTSVCKTCP